ncbi:MAG: hypothetical protein R3C05_05230 [Pirellulaceae bacterium]
MEGPAADRDLLGYQPHQPAGPVVLQNHGVPGSISQYLDSTFVKPILRRVAENEVPRFIFHAEGIISDHARRNIELSVADEQVQRSKCRQIATQI